MSNNHFRVWYPAFAVGLICLLVYLPALRCGFVNVDDPDYILNNPLIKELDFSRVISIFTQSHLGWWMPLNWVSLAIDYHFWGENPFGYHLTNILLHAANASLVVLIADRAVRRGEGAAISSGIMYSALLIFSGLFFGLHPLRVESVAWASERKDVLNGFFCFLSILFYIIFAESREGGGGRSRGLYYALSLCCFVLSLMAKSVSVVLPLMFLIFDRSCPGSVRRGTIVPLVLEKVPFLAVAAVMTAITFIFASRSQYLVTYEMFPFFQRAAVSGNAIWEYSRMLVLPVGLSPFNVIPDPVPTAYYLKSALVLTAVAAVLYARIPILFKSCLLCSLLPLLPVLAFFQNGDQSFADRFTYLPSLTVSVFLMLLLLRICTDSVLTQLSRVILGGGFLVALLFMVGTVRQIGVWRTAETYWNRVIAVEPLAISYKERGRYYHAVGRYDAAVADFTSAIARVTATLRPYDYNLYAYRGESLRVAGRSAEAVNDFTAAIARHPHPVYYFHRGLALRDMGRTAEADVDFRRAGPDPGPVTWIN